MSKESMPHRIQVFSGGCKLCEEAAEIVEIGKCKDCRMEVLSIDGRKTKPLMKRYSIGAVPSIVIDGKIKVVGIPTFPWLCGDGFYEMLERRYPLGK
ncbi:MAG: thioredoxin family protein [Nitrososphaerales archaeon]|nr:thioredoxin family protein [Nitrososphaerales archaeon]